MKLFNPSSEDLTPRIGSARPQWVAQSVGMLLLNGMNPETVGRHFEFAARERQQRWPHLLRVRGRDHHLAHTQLIRMHEFFNPSSEDLKGGGAGTAAALAVASR